MYQTHLIEWHHCRWVMIICSKFDCSKNLLNTILLLLDTIRANDKKSEKWSTIKKYLPYVYFEQFHFQTKKYQLLELHCSTKVLENDNCSTQFIVKKMLYMYGSQVRCTCMAVRIGVHVWQQVRLGQVRWMGAGVWGLAPSQVMKGQTLWGWERGSGGETPSQGMSLGLKLIIPTFQLVSTFSKSFFNIDGDELLS